MNPQDIITQVFGLGRRIDWQGNAYHRRAVLVSQHPLAVHLHDLNASLLNAGSDARKLLLTSALVALNQNRLGEDEEGTPHWVVKQDSPFFDYQPSKIAEEQLGPWESKTVLPPEDFDRYADAFMSGLANEQRLRHFILLTEELAPEMQIAPRRVHELLTREGYTHLPRYFARHNLFDYDCLVWIERSSNQLSKAELLRLRLDDIPCVHLGGGWYAFKSIDDAMALKLLAKQTEVHPLRD
jgi:hypothetical protein